MDKKIKLQNKVVKYDLKTSKRARRMRLAVYCDGSFVVTRPYGMRDDLVEKFLREKAGWILGKLEHFKPFKGLGMCGNNEKHYREHREEAMIFATKMVRKMNKIYDFEYNKINIKNQKTRWGSCSRKGNLNFNYKIIFLSERLAEYIIVHELCHLKEFNHSKRFWNLVALAVPDYYNVRKQLKYK